MKDFQQIKLYRYPLFIILISYCFIEISNPFIGHFLQIIPRIKNSHLAIIIAWLVLPKTLKTIILPKNKLFLALPFLIIILIKTPFVDIMQENTIIAVVSEWIFYILYFPLFAKLFCTKDGRECFFISIGISSIIGSLIFIIYLSGTSLMDNISSNSMAYLNVFGLPVALRGVFFKSGFERNFYFSALITLLFIAIFSGSRANLVISTLQTLVFIFYFASFKKILLGGIIISTLLLFLSSVANIDQEKVEFRNKKFNRILNWKEDGSIFLRFALYTKASDIFSNNILMGAGWGSRTLSGIEGGLVEIESFSRGDYLDTAKKGLHSTYLRIISGTGLIGIICFLYFLINNIIYFIKIKFSLLKKIPEFFVFLSISIGIFISAFQNTMSFSSFLIISSFIISANLTLDNLRMIHLMKLKYYKI